MAVKVKNVTEGQVLVAFNDKREKVVIRPGEEAEISQDALKALAGKVVKVAKKKSEGTK